MPLSTEDNGGLNAMDEAYLLVPWYVSGKLEAAEARRVEELARQDPELQALIEEARREARTVAAINEASGGPSPALWARIEQSVLQQEREQAARPKPWLASMWTGFSAFWEGISAPQWQAVAAAAAVVCVIEAGAIGYFASVNLAGGKAPAGAYQTASGPAASAAKKAEFIVTFAPSASVGEAGKLLDSLGLAIVDGPDADMRYHLAMRGESAVSKDQAYAKLLGSSLVSLAVPEQ